MQKFKRVAIIGVGLMGGSIGLAIRKNRLAKEVVGVCRTPHSVRLARKIGAIDWGTTNSLQAVQGSDLVILATPIRLIPILVKHLARHLEPGSILMDVASTKGALVKEIEKFIPKDVIFIGSHPMAGRERRGVTNASATLFQGNLCFITRRPHTPLVSLRSMITFWKALGSRVKVVGIEEHDRLVASLSHLPHVVTALLVLNADKIEFAGTGFKDITRVVSSDPSLWQDILLSNQKEILKSMDRFRKRLDGMIALLRKKKVEAILSQLQKAKRLRDRLIR